MKSLKSIHSHFCDKLKIHPPWNEQFAPENMVSQKESNLPTMNCSGAMLVSGRVNLNISLDRKVMCKYGFCYVSVLLSDVMSFE